MRLASRFAIFIAVTLAALSEPILAALITFEFEGVIGLKCFVCGDGSEDFGTGISPGTPFTGRYTFDSDTPASPVSPQRSLYFGVSFDLTIGSETVSGNDPSNSLISIANGPPGGDSYSLLSSSFSSGTIAGLGIDRFSWVVSATSSLFADTSLPLNPDFFDPLLQDSRVCIGDCFGGEILEGAITNLALALSLVPPATMGLTPNATAVAAEVDTFITSDPEITAAFFTLSTTEEFNAALESLAPDMSGAVQSATFAAHHFAIDNVEKRLASLRTGGGMMTGMSAGDPYQDVGMWLQGFASTIDQDNRDLVAGFNADTVGVAFGVDKLLNNNLLVGAALSYAATDVETNGSGNTTDIDSYQGGLYANYESGPWYMDGVLYYAYNDYDGRRTIPLVGRVANADYDANQIGIKATLGREYSFNADTYLTPYLGLYYVYLDVDDYTETGAGAANLTVDNEENQALQSTLGVSLRREVETATGLKMVPEAHVAWLHEFLDEGQVNTSTFTGGGSSFTTRGFDPANDSLNVGASLAIYSENNIDVKASYDFEVKDDYDSHSGLLVFRYDF